MSSSAVCDWSGLACRYMLACKDGFIAVRALHEVGALIAGLVDGTRLESEVIKADAVFLVTQMADIPVDFSVFEHFASMNSSQGNVMSKVLVVLAA